MTEFLIIYRYSSDGHEFLVFQNHLKLVYHETNREFVLIENFVSHHSFTEIHRTNYSLILSIKFQ